MSFIAISTLRTRGPEYDGVGKVRHIGETLAERVAAVNEPEKEVSIDEAMKPFKGWSCLYASESSQAWHKGVG